MAKDKFDTQTIDMFEDREQVLEGADQRKARARERGAVVNSEPAESSLSTGNT